MAISIDLWPCLLTTKLSYAQLFKWGHSKTPLHYLAKKIGIRTASHEVKHRSKKGCNYYGTLKMARIFHGLHGRAGEAIDVIGHRLWPQRATYAWKVSSTMQAYVLKYFYRVNFKGIGSINNSCGTTFYCTNIIELVMSDVSKVNFSFLF